MPEEPEAELQATANLSPVSPSPVHTASPLVVPALQDTVETIDAMVAAAAASNGDTEAVAQNGVPPASNVALPTGDVEIVDDDNDPYGDETTTAEPTVAEPPKEQADSTNDEYAKTFDSPVNPEEGEDGEDGGGEHQEDVSSVPQSNNMALPSDSLTSRQTNASHPVSDDPSLAHPSTVAATVPPSAAQPEADAGSLTTTTSQGPESAQAAPQPYTTGGSATGASQEPPPADLRQLVADLTAQNAASSSSPDPSSPVHTEQPAAPNSLSSSATVPSTSSLPPRPPQPSAPFQTYPSQHHPAGSNSGIQASAVAPPTTGQASTYVAAGAPGTSTEAISGLPPPPATGLNAPSAVPSLNTPAHPAQALGNPVEKGDDEYQRAWDQFVADERQYMSDAKWDRFPEGSRIFIGNLSSDKVSKRDVFDMFHRFGRLAQISLKSAYGFVQYHTIEEGQRAIDNLQGIEIKGRRIHLEVSRLQDKSKKERAKSPDRGRGSRDGGRRNDRHGHQRDDHRGRHHSPRRNDYRDGYGRERGGYDSGRARARSRSPGYGRSSRDTYRRRSPSPYGRSRDESELDLPRRYDADVPDVQIILQADVNRDFVAWVEGIFKSKGLTTHNMFLHPRMPKDQVIQRQAAEGVHGVVDLDFRAQSTGKVPVQAFDRSAGGSKVRFDQYVDLEPGIAAEVILRTKASSAPSYAQPYSGGVPGGYPQGYGGHAQPPAPAPAPAPAPPNNFYGAPQPSPQPGSYPPPQQPPANQADIASLMGNVDNATLQRLVSSIQQAPQGGMPPAPAHTPQGNTPQIGQTDLQTILNTLGSNTTAMPQQAPPQAQYGAPYGGRPVPTGGPSQTGGGDSATQVQNIMAQLARYRQ